MAQTKRIAETLRSLKHDFIKHEISVVVVESMGATLRRDYSDVSGQSPGAGGSLICSFNGKLEATSTDSPTPAASR
jgi:hypothetical protein